MAGIVRFGMAALAAAAVLSAGVAVALDDVDVTAQVRLRFEGDDRSFEKDVSSEYYTLQRVRLAAKATTEGGTKLFVQIQDSRQWGQEGNTLNDTQNVDLHQAWFLVPDLGVQGLDLLAGRAELNYGQQRVIGAVGWHNVGRSFDLVRLRGRRDSHWVDGFVSKVSDEVGEVEANEDLYALIGHGALLEGDLVIEPLLLYKRRVPGGLFVTSVGDYARGQFGRIGFMQDFVYQTGKRMQGDVSAYLISVDLFADVSPDQDEKIGVGGGFSLYTGDDPDKSDDGAYDQLYPTLHKFHGLMDVAVGIADTDGLMDVNGKVWWKPGRGWTLKGAFHSFSTELDVPAGSGTAKTIGQEIDVVAKKKLTQGLALELVGATFLPGDVAKERSGEEAAYWFSVEATAAI